MNLKIKNFNDLITQCVNAIDAIKFLENGEEIVNQLFVEIECFIKNNQLSHEQLTLLENSIKDLISCLRTEMKELQNIVVNNVNLIEQHKKYLKNNIID